MENVKPTKLADMNQLDLFVKGTREMFAEIAVKKERVKELLEWRMRDIADNLPTQAIFIEDDGKDICEIELSMRFLWHKDASICDVYSLPHRKLKEILEKEGKYGNDAFREIYNLVQDYFRGKDVVLRHYRDDDTSIGLRINVSANLEDTSSPSSDPLKNLIYKAREYMKNKASGDVYVKTIMEEFFEGVNNGFNRSIEVHDDDNCIYATFKMTIHNMSEESKTAFKGLSSLVVQEIDDMVNYGRKMEEAFISYLKNSNVEVCKFRFLCKNVISIGISFSK